MNTEGTLLPRLYFSYGQFMIFDSTELRPGCYWTDAHIAQGFARRESVLAVATLLQWGYADLKLHRAAYLARNSYERAVAVPFRVTSGRVLVEGIEEEPGSRCIELPVGNYCLTVAQRTTGSDQESVDLFFEQLIRPMARSIVVVADEALNPPAPLIESVDIA